MSNTKYAFQSFDEAKMSRAYGSSLAISSKKAVETCKWIKGKKTGDAVKMLSDVIALKRAVPYRRFNQELAHQKSVGPGGYPINVCKSILQLVKSAELNAGAKGLNTESLRIVHVCAHTASRPFRYGRKSRVKAKRTHVELVVEELEQKKAKPTKSKSAKATESAKAEKPKEKAESVKPATPEVEKKVEKEEAKQETKEESNEPKETVDSEEPVKQEQETHTDAPKKVQEDASDEKDSQKPKDDAE